jgi:DNA-binding response OmpR family regulator
MSKALILIIDHSRETRIMYGDYLRYHGYAVAEAADAEEGMRQAGALQPDLIVTELFDEPSWIRAIRLVGSSGSAREIAIIACSTQLDSALPWAPHGMEVDSALAKPTTPRTLLQEVDRLLRRAHGDAVAGCHRQYLSAAGG